MSNNKGLLITNNNIYGLVNPPPKPTRRDGAGPHHDISSAAVRWVVCPIEAVQDSGILLEILSTKLKLSF